MNWIKTSDRMPELDTNVLVHTLTLDPPVAIAMYWGDDYWSSELGGLKVTHWQPLPEPPAE